MADTTLSTSTWTPTQRRHLIQHLTRETTRLNTRNTCTNAHQLACHVDPNMVPTPMLDTIATELATTINTPNGRLVISCPPQLGKSTTTSVWGTIHALITNPDMRIVIASYSETLAQTHARAARNIINTWGSNATDPITGQPLPDKLGIAIADDKAAAAHWELAGHKGGLYAVGVGGSLTGRAADLLIIDDPIRSMTDADSTAVKRTLIDWWEAVALTRLAPGAPVILIQTRWAEDDLAGHVLTQDNARPPEERTWRFINLPAIATPGIPDILNRKPGQPLHTARGHTLHDWQRIKDAVGPRVWSALYLGNPTPAEGGLFAREWFIRHRTSTLPDTTAARIVSIDPAETGKGDEAGIVALTAAPDGTIYLTDDWSGRMTSDQWARTAIHLALTTGATEILFEAFTTGPTYEQVIRHAWQDTRRDPPPGVTVPNTDTPPFCIHPWRAKGDKTARAAGTRQAASTGRLRLIGTHPHLEDQAAQWQQGQGSPDRVDAMVNGYERLCQLLGQQAVIATPTRTPTTRTTTTGFWGRSMPTGI